MYQTPKSGKHLLLFKGDTITFRLKLTKSDKGQAYLRTNIGNAKIHRNEIINKIENSLPMTGLDWQDFPMDYIGENTFSITLALAEVGHFEGKCFLYPENSHEPVWCDGENVHINVEPATYCAANSIYCAFVRQFGINKNRDFSDVTDNYVRNIVRLDEDGYTVIPPSGTFRDLQREIDFIFDKLHCRILHLLPVNPVPTVYARMGRYGSPYASLDYTAIDPSLVEFDKYTTPLEQFFELIDDVHMKKGKVIIDLAINHTGWAAKIHETHPEWLKREADGKIVSPGAWGVTWGDLTELDNNHLELWKFFADVFITWCERGIDGFRCDAGYMIPVPVWEYIIARVRDSYPDTVFLLEGLGGDPAITRELLDKASMNWAYSELFQNYTSEEIKRYMPYAEDVSNSDGLMVNYAETHDNSRMAAVSPTYSKMRTSLCALTAPAGAFAFANGVEWYATEKIDVHESSGLNWGSATRFIDARGTDPKYTKDVLGFIRKDKKGKHPLLILCNLNSEESTRICFYTPKKEKGESIFLSLLTKKSTDLLTKDERLLDTNIDNEKSILLLPGEVVCLTNDNISLDNLNNAEKSSDYFPKTITTQKAKAMVVSLLTIFQKTPQINKISKNNGIYAKNSTATRMQNHDFIPLAEAQNSVDIDKLAQQLLDNPAKHFAEHFATEKEIPLVKWNSIEDLHREVMIPPGHAILVTERTRFRVAIKDQNEILYQYDSIIDSNNNNFVIIPPLPRTPIEKRIILQISQFGSKSLCRESATIVLLSDEDNPISLSINNSEIRKSHSTFLSTNGRGAMVHIPIACCDFTSKYDAFLSANLNNNYPVDRWIMWNGCRILVKNQTHTQELSVDTIESFRLIDNNRGCWNMHVPVGNGKYVDIRITLFMLAELNATSMTIERLAANNKRNYLNDKIPVTIKLHIDIEDRSFHNVTKSSDDATMFFKNAISYEDNAFTFTPSAERKLVIKSSKTASNESESLNIIDGDAIIPQDSNFKYKPQWRYNLHRKLEAERGLESKTELFTPGYFNIPLTGATKNTITGEILMGNEISKTDPIDPIDPIDPTNDTFENILQKSMQHYIVKRDELKTVIAGYPWFLDWGRDTLICARGIIASGNSEDVADILLAFAKFAENGTLPNIIHGAEAGNRDTSDAPLWLFTACEDFCNEFPLYNILNKNIPSKDKKLIDVLEDIANYYISGTPNGIKMDIESGLIFSPSHFTWMDTNYPAGTPRQGYPIEIQSLWFAALNFLYIHTEKERWLKLSKQVQNSIKTLYVNDEGWLSDCLHSSINTPAKLANRDDALRPNQLLAITLGAVDEHNICKNILEATSKLLVPGAIRSLANRPVKTAIPVKNNKGNLLNDPLNPYWGHYIGDEDSRRKPAYHNGTAWTWLFPSYSEAYLLTYGKSGRGTSKAILSSSKALLRQGCIGHIPEILDGDSPHIERGCDAQAWGVTELYRVWKIIKNR